MGKIKKLHQGALVGEGSSEEVYPVTAAQAVYHSNGSDLETLIDMRDPVSVLQDAGTGKTTITVGSDSYDVATEPVSVSQNTENGHITLNIGSVATDIPSFQDLANIKAGLNLINVVGSPTISYFPNPFKTGKRYKVKNLSAKQISFYAFNSSKVSLGSLVKKDYLSVNEEIILTFNTQNVAYIGGYVDDTEYSIIITEIDESLLNADYNIGKEISFVAPNAGITYYGMYPVISGKRYRVTNNTTTIISLILRYDATDDTTQKQIKSPVAAGEVVEFTADNNYNYIGGYCGTQPYNIAVVPIDGIYNELGDMRNDINVIAENEGYSKKVLSASAGTIYDFFPFIAGKTYKVTNISNGILSVNLKETKDGEVTQEIISPLNVGASVSFTPIDGARYIGGYSSYGYAIIVESEFGIVNDLTQIQEEVSILNNTTGQKCTFAKNGAGTLRSQYAFIEGKRYIVKNNSLQILSIYLYDKSGNELLEIASPAKPHYTYFFTAPSGAYTIGGYSNYGYNITLLPIESLVNDIEELSCLPSYYTEYLKNKIQTINRLRISSGEHGDIFIFITDTHLEKNNLVCLPLIKYISKRTPIKKLIHGGDSCSISANYEPVYGWDTINDTFNWFYSAIVGAIKGGGRFLGVLGNHDFNNRIYSGGSSEITGVDLESRRNILLSLCDEISVSGDKEGCYYYFDNEVSKLRYIILDTSYRNIDGGPNIGGTQFQWFVDTVNATPDGYNIIVVEHIPVFMQIGEFDSANVAFMADVLSAINNKESGSVTIGGVSYNYDFSQLGADIVLNLNGHTHSDSEVYLNKVLSIGSLNNGSTESSPSENMFETGILAKTNGSITEQSFDVYILNKEHIHTIRIGAGGDRHFHKTIITPSNGMDLSEMIQFIEPSSWMSCDSDTLSIDESGDYPEWEYTNTILSVNDGVITLLGGTGDAMVCAIDANLNKEIFLIHVD